MKKIKNVNASTVINIIALAISMWTLVYTIAELLHVNATIRILVSTVVALASFMASTHFINENTDCTKAWDDEED